MPDERFCLMPDDSGHWYIVPWQQRDAFEQWLVDVGKYWDELPGGDEPKRPVGARELGRHPSFVSFTNPEVA